MIGVVNSKYKTSLCRHWEQNGACQLGAKCHFAHGVEELRKQNDPLPPGVTPLDQKTMLRPTQNIMPGFGNTPTGVPMQTGGQKMPTPSNYKTVKCKYFEQNGFCKFGENCTFAHGDQEIRKSAGTGGSSPYKPPTQQNFGGNMIPYQDMSMIAQQQLTYLINELEEYHSSHPEFSYTIKNAKELNNAGNMQSAAMAIYGIINRADKSKDDTQKYNKVMKTMQDMGSSMYQNYQMQQYMQGVNPSMYPAPMEYNMGYSDMMSPQVPYYSVPTGYMQPMGMGGMNMGGMPSGMPGQGQRWGSNSHHNGARPKKPSMNAA